MGSKKRKKEVFLRRHPICCFCGGDSAAQEIDHIPSRVFFENRQWPEGYEFPACVSCNRATRHDEQAVAMIARMFPDPTTENARREVKERIRAVAHNYPALYQELSPNIRQIRAGITAYGLEKPAGMSTLEMPLFSLEGPLVRRAISNFGRKLSLALYYFHTEKIVPTNGGVALRWFTNLQIQSDHIPVELAPITSKFPTLQRSKQILDDQFFYRYGISEDRDVAVFLSFFSKSFAILGYISVDRENFELPEEAIILGPLKPST